MNSWVKIAVGFSAGVLVGTIGTYIALKEKFQKTCNDAIREYREYSNQRISMAQQQKDEDNSKESYDEAKKNYKDSFTDYTTYAVVNNNTDKINELSERMIQYRDELNKISKEVHDDDFDVHMADREAPVEGVLSEEEESELESNQILADIEQAEQENRDPYPITSSEMANQKQWYEKLIYTYYSGDDTLVDEQDDPIVNPENIVGDRWQENFGYETNDPDVCCIRNDMLASDYEISRLDRKYTDDYPTDEKTDIKNDGAYISW